MARQQLHYRHGTAAFSKSLCGALVTAAMCSPVLARVTCRRCYTRYQRGLGVLGEPVATPAAVLHYGMATTRHAVAAPTLCAATVAVEHCTVAVQRVTCPDCVAHPLLALVRQAVVFWPAS